MKRGMEISAQIKTPRFTLPVVRAASAWRANIAQAIAQMIVARIEILVKKDVEGNENVL